MVEEKRIMKKNSGIENYLLSSLVTVLDVKKTTIQNMIIIIRSEYNY